MACVFSTVQLNTVQFSKVQLGTVQFYWEQLYVRLEKGKSELDKTSPEDRR